MPACWPTPQWLGDMVFDTIPGRWRGRVPGWRGGADRAWRRTSEQFGRIVALLNAKGGKARSSPPTASRRLLPEGAAYADRAAGMIAIPLSRNPRDYVVLFRSEQMRAVRWAGNPEKPVELGPHGDRLTPRKSFELWSELVKGQSLPFTAAERRVAEGAAHRHAGRAGAAVAMPPRPNAPRAHERQELLIAELNHRVRNILALIRGADFAIARAPRASGGRFHRHPGRSHQGAGAGP